MKSLIEPKLLKGFRDFLPASETSRKNLMAKLEACFRLAGFVPIDTPAIEYAEILLGKSGGETEKQVYTFMDQGERQVALRFDLTVPFARFLALHRHEISLPFRRFHTAKVWRGEKPHAGRFREFMQCDFDCVGSDSLSTDLEILVLMYRSMKSIGIEDFKIHLSHRGIFNALLAKLSCEAHSVEILRAVDKIKKQGIDAVSAELSSILKPEISGKILEFVSPLPDFASTLKKCSDAVGKDNPCVMRMEQLGGCFRDLGIQGYFVFDTSITRGLDYYTGVVFETFLTRLPDIGSVCSGGRYDNLVSLYSKESIPGIGASVGLDRLMAALETLGQLQGAQASSDVIITCMDEVNTGYYHSLAEILRSEGISTEVFPEKKKLLQQFTYAEKNHIPIAIIAGSQEREKNVVNVRDLRSRENHDGIIVSEAIVRIKNLLGH